MITLGVNTAGSICSIGIVKDKLMLGEFALDLQWIWLKGLIPAIEETLQSNRLKIEHIDLFAIVVGPGSWTGLRVGVATLKTFAFTLQKPIVGVTTLDVLAYNIRFVSLPLYTVMDADKGRVYYAGYNCHTAIPERVTDYAVTSVEEFLDNIRRPSIVIGDACTRYKQRISEKKEIIMPSPLLNQVRGAFVAEAGSDKHIQSGPDDTFSIAPFYMQKTSAEIKWEQN